MAIHILHDPRCADYSASGHPERPARVVRTVKRLREARSPVIRWEEPDLPGETAILRAHDPSHLGALRNSRNDFDGDTPAYPEIDAHARRATGAALGALRHAEAGRTAFSLMRPPGHHSTRTRAMGFCYINSVAVAVLEARAAGRERVAVLDFDVHHGNGTEEILLGTDGTAFFSVHQHPCYPGTGTRSIPPNVFNYPVPPYCPRREYRATLEKALEGLRAFQPDLVAVSAGFDAYARDPLAQGTLEAEDFQWLGENVRALDCPAFSVLEGGYSEDLPELVLAYLLGLDPGDSQDNPIQPPPPARTTEGA